MSLVEEKREAVSGSPGAGQGREVCGRGRHGERAGDSPTGHEWCSALCVDILQARWIGTLPEEISRPCGDGNLVSPERQEPGLLTWVATEFRAPHRVPGARRAEGLPGVRAGADLEDIRASLDSLEVTDPSPGPRASQHCTAFITLGVEGRGGSPMLFRGL